MTNCVLGFRVLRGSQNHNPRDSSTLRDSRDPFSERTPFAMILFLFPTPISCVLLNPFCTIRSAERDGFDYGVDNQLAVKLASCTSRGLHGSHDLKTLKLMVLWGACVVLKLSSRGSRGFCSSRDFQCEKRASPFLNNRAGRSEI